MLKRRSGIRSIILILLFMASRLATAQHATDSAHNSGDFEIIERVSLIKLLTYPQKFDGKLVQVIGFLDSDLGHEVLCAHKEDYDSSLLDYCIMVSFDRNIVMSRYPEKQLKIQQERKFCNKRYVRIIGRFNDYTGSSPYEAGLFDIFELERWRTNR